jgi:amino acid adenylation domain-containing protein
MSGSTLADILPVAPAQEGLLYHALLDVSGPDVYMVQARFQIGAPVDADALRRAVKSLLVRHPNLRCCFRHKGLDRPVQLIPRAVTVPWTEVDLSDCQPAQAQERLRELADADRARRFDVTRPPLLRCTLVRLGERAMLILTMHHILVDGWSLPILARELAALYSGHGAELPAAPQYRNYLAWLRGQDNSLAVEAWRSALAGFEQPTLLGPDPAAPDRATGPAALPDEIPFELSAPLSEALRRLARESGVTVNTLCQAAWGLVLARMTGTRDAVFGAVVSGRPAELPGVESMVGMFINTLPVRVRLRSGERVRELLARLQEEQLRLAAHHHVRLADVQRLAGPGELFDTVLAFENYPRDVDPPEDVRLRLTDARDATHYPLTLAIVTGERLWLQTGYRPDCFSQAEAELITGRLVRALEAMTEDPDALVDRIDVLPEPERRKLLLSWNDTDRPLGAANVLEQFAAQVARAPQAMAVECADRGLTYAELETRAGFLADRLVAAGIVPDAPVAVLLDRSPDLVIAQLAVLKAGGCYAPLDPAQPEARLNWLLSDAGAGIVIADKAPGWLPDGLRVLTPDSESTGPVEPAAATAPPVSRPAPSADSAAYVMYTSGSTGRPKGVVVTHRNVVELAADRCFKAEAHQRVLLHSPHTFDAATYESWVPLLNGGTVVVAPPGPFAPDNLKKTVAQGRITALFLTAELFRTLADTAPDCFAELREVWTGGDVVSPEAVRRVLTHCPDITVVNGYGPTETTTIATCRPVRNSPHPDTRTRDQVPIGRPLDNSGAYVLDSDLRPTPVGRVGELYLTGTGLARGYLGRPALTAERFVAAPWSAEQGPTRSGARMYRTGDLAEWTVDGEIRFAGRADAQVKIRGFRVEPGEVERALESCPGVARAVVTARPDPAGGKLLVAYLVLSQSATSDDDLDAVRRAMVDRLPAHLLPSHYLTVDRIPVTAHEKVDLSALPMPILTPQSPAGAQTTATAGSPREQVLCDLFSQVLGIPAGPETNFFTAGGHSLLAMRLTAAIESTLGVRVPISILFGAATPAALGDRLDHAGEVRGRGESEAADPVPMLTLRAEGDRTPLFFLPPGMGFGWAYAALLPHLAPDRPLYALQSPALARGAALPTSIEQIAREYLLRIRAAQPVGPYLLAGRSFGGLIAYELAAQLRRAGQEVGLLALLDTVPLSAEDDGPMIAGAELEQYTLSVLLSDGRVGAPQPGPLHRTDVFPAVREGSGVLQGWDDRRLTAAADMFSRHIQLTYAYRPPPLDSRVLLFSAVAEPGGFSSAAKAARWHRTAPDVRVHDLDCAHSNVLSPAPVAQIAAVLGPVLRRF